ncbi:heavy-metal-associated domain-containing protein [Rhodococcus aetherivorans]|uniref:heavy-metal-associated domain-containing protein n=1 Tax=Rhodococcus aetherivorans TaxID=191292 RepID=UPI0035E7E392
MSNDIGLTDKNHECACGPDSHAAATSSTHLAPVGTDVTREHYLVEGMTCSHCVASVTEEVSGIDGVESVSVDLKAGAASRIMVVSDRPVPVEQVRDAVVEAGYTLVVG